MKNRQNLERRQAELKFSASERARRRSELLTERRKAKTAKKVFRHNQQQYLRRKKVKAALIRGEREAYQQSIRAFNELCQELRDTAARLKGARTSYENSLPSIIKLQLEFSRGWTEGRETLLREQGERIANETRDRI